MADKGNGREGKGRGVKEGKRKKRDRRVGKGRKGRTGKGEGQNRE